MSSKSKCAKCNNELLDDDIVIKCTVCQEKRHALCAKIDPCLATRKRWWCRKCSKRDNRCGIKVSNASLVDANRYSGLLIAPSTPPPVPPTSRDPAFHMKTDNQAMADGDKPLAPLRKNGNSKRSLTERSNKFAQMVEQIKSIQTICDEIAKKNAQLEEELKEYKLKLEDMEQRSRKNAVEIWGIPLTDGEDLMKLVERLFSTIKWIPNSKDGYQVESVMRLPKSDEEFSIARKLVKIQIPLDQKSVLWINFVTSLGKEGFVNRWKAVERSGGVSLAQLGFNQEGQVKMETSLTSYKLQLFQKALERAKEFQYSRVGVMNGEVYLLRDSRSGPLIYVKSTQDLDKLVKYHLGNLTAVDVL